MDWAFYQDDSSLFEWDGPQLPIVVVSYRHAAIL